jgi:hypothetical protein
MHVAVQTLALGFETFENALRDVHGLAVAMRLWLDAGAEEVGDARFDVLRDELKLLQSPVRALRALVELALGRSARLGLRHALVRARELLDLLARAPDIAPQRVDQRIELRFEVVRVFDESRRLWSRFPSIWTDIAKFGDRRVSAWSLQQYRACVATNDTPALRL